MLASAYCYQIHSLVSSLDSLNHRTHIEELKNLVMSLGDSGRGVLISSLLDEIDFRENSMRDMQRVALLHDEIILATRQANFASMICQAVEGGTRASVLLQRQRLPEGYLLDIIRVLKLSLMQTIVFMWGLSKSNIRGIAMDSIDILKKRLPDVHVNVLVDTADDLLQNISLTVGLTPDLAVAEVCEAWFTAVAGLEKGGAILSPLFGVAAGQDPNMKLSADVQRIMTNLSNTVGTGRRRNSLTALLTDLGHQCSASVDIFKRLLYLLKVTEQTIDEAQIAEIIVAILPQTPRVRTNTPPGQPGGVKHEHIPIYNQIKESDADVIKMDQTKEWNLDNVVEVLKQYCMARQSLAASGATLMSPSGTAVPIMPINWNLLVRSLDQPLLRIKSEAEFQIIIKILLRLTNGKAVSAEGLIKGVWSNKAAQIALLMLSTNVTRNFVDFSSLVSPDQVIRDPTNTVQQPQNFSWMAVPVYQTLMDLAASGMSSQVLEVLSVAASIYPEYVTIGLAQVHDPSSGVRTEILRRTLPLFTGVASTVTTTTVATASAPAVTQTVPTRPTSVIVMKRLFEVNNIDMLILLCRFSLKKVSSASEIHEADLRFKGFPNNIVRRRLEEECGPEELFGYWCLLADKGEISSLDEKLKSVLEKNPAMSRQLYVFCANHVKTLRPSVHTYATTTNGGLLSVDNFNTILRLLQGYPSLVSVDQLRLLAHEAQQSQGQGQQMGMTPEIVQGFVAGGNNLMGGGSTGIEDVSAVGGGGVDAEIEKEANAYFQRIYTSEMTINDVVALFKLFKNSSNPREQEVFRCMIHNLFDEYRFFHNYPDRELQVTGRLFGTLIQHQLISSITLGVALRYVLEALRKDPDIKQSPPQPTNLNEKMFRFGVIALEQFRSRLPEWPQYCSHVLQVPHLRRFHPELYNEAQRALGGANISAPSNANTGIGSNSPMLSMTGQPQQQMVQQQQHMQMLSAQGQGQGQGQGGMGMVDQNQNQGQNIMQDMQGHGVAVGNSNDFNQGQQQHQQSPARVPMPLPLPPSASAAAVPMPAPMPPPAPEVVDNRPTVIDRMVLVNTEVSNANMPAENVRDRIHFIVNNVAKDNVESKCNDLKALLISDHYNWFANYLVVKRISTQPNLHPVYIAILDSLASNALVKTVMNSTFHNVTKLLQSPKIQSSSSERSLLRNLAIWIGQMTLGRNTVLLQRKLDLKELLLWGYETGRLIAVCSFVVKVVEGAKDSKVFKLPNPWLLALLGVFRELNELDDLKMNIKFEIQVLYKTLGIKMEEVPKQNILATRKSPVKSAANPDFSNKNLPPAAVVSNVTSPSPGGGMMSAPASGLPPTAPLPASAGGGSNAGDGNNSGQPHPNIVALMQEQTVIPNLTSYVVVNPSLAYFQQNPSYRKLLALAVDKAIREIILPVVERAVNIASVTTKTLVPKDFMFEPNEAPVKSSAQVMVSSLAGSLAVISCREPLRISISNHLRSVFTPLLVPNAANASDAAVALLEQIVQVCANDNVELGCVLIEKAATEKSVREIDEALASTIQLRRKSRETGQPFADSNQASTAASKYFQDLPDYLKPKAGVALTAQQLAVYETGFQRPSASAVQNASRSVSSSAPAAGSGSGSGSGSSPTLGTPARGPLLPGIVDVKPLPPAAGVSGTTAGAVLTLQQAMEAYHHCFVRLDTALKTIQQQILQRGLNVDQVNLSMLGGDHEIVAILREIAFVANSTQTANNARQESATAVFENIFKRLIETAHSSDLVRIETLVAILESLKDHVNVPPINAAGVAIASNAASPQSTPGSGPRANPSPDPVAAVSMSPAGGSNLPSTAGGDGNNNNGSGSVSYLSQQILVWLQQLSGYAFNMADDHWRSKHRLVLLYLLRSKVLSSAAIDEYFANQLDSGRNIVVIELALTFVKQCLVGNLAATHEFSKIFDVVSKMNPSNVAVRKQLQKWLQDLRALAAAKEEELGTAKGESAGASAAAIPVLPNTGSGASGGISAADAANAELIRRNLMALLERWMLVWNSGNDQLYSQYLQVIQQYGVLKTEDSAERFFRGTTEICIEACLKTIAPATPGSNGPDGLPVGEGATTTVLTYTVIDALSKLFLLLIRVADKEAASASAAAGGQPANSVENSIAIRANILLKILSCITRVLNEDHDGIRQQQQLNPRATFDQRPYHRLLLNLVNELGPSEPKVEQSVVFVPLLAVYTQAFLLVAPTTAPGFAFSWLSIVSHANFMPHLLLSRDRKGWPLMHKLMRAQLLFLQPFLKTIQLNDSIRRLYKETLRVLLVLLHDFPEFLCDYYVSFCDVIPSTCVQLRNLILSAFPSNMRLPDPFTPDLKIESLAEITQSPRMVTDFIVALHGVHNGAFKSRVDNFLQSPNSAANAELLSVANLLPVLCIGDPVTSTNVNGTTTVSYVCNIPLISSLVVYVGAFGADQLKTATSGGAKVSVQQTSAYAMLKYLVTVVSPDAEFRYQVLNCMANQLRYPNSHTYFHSCLFLQLFQDLNESCLPPSPSAAPGTQELLIQEQITRVFLERLIVHRPHPWGLLVTFIEFLKNPKYQFWQKPFTHCAAEIERVLESVTKSCVSAAGAGAGAGVTAGAPTAVSPVL